MGGLVFGLLATGPAIAEVVRFEVLNQVPVFDGASFGETGTYERIDAVAHIAIDPNSPRGQKIVDLDKAPRNADGMVEFSTEVFVLRPTDADNSNGVLFYEVPNRGRNLAFLLMNLSGGTGVPETSADAGDGFLMEKGYTIVWSGWQSDVDEAMINATFPIAEGVTGPSRDEFIFNKPDPVITAKLSYPAADMDPAKASLTVRQRATDPRSTAPGLSFRYLSETEIEITRPEALDAGAIYEFVYPAKDAQPRGLAFVATADVVSFLRGNPGHGSASPLSGVDRTVALGISQSGRFLRDFIYQGFNADAGGARVFDGAMPHIAGSRKTFTNYRFAQPGRYSRQHEDHDFPGDQFPFTYAETNDPLTGRTDSMLAECRASDTCPKIIHTDTATEFWQARAALLTTSPTGEALSMPEDVRLFFLAGAPHFAGWTSESKDTALCRFSSNPISSGPVMRALLAGMRAWVVDGTPPPDSRYPTLADGTLVPLGKVALPDLADDNVVPVYNVLQVQDHGSVPPAAGAAYPVLVPQMDADGIAIGGVATPRIAAPLGTYLGWNLRKPGLAPGNLCSLTGSFLPFPADKAAAVGDGRTVLSDRYPDAAAYGAAVEAKARELAKANLMLPADVSLVTERATADFDALK
ncbi:MAG: alpha/beta hydrolase domain-containing protein [Paracoccaceae bacterium]